MAYLDFSLLFWTSNCFYRNLTNKITFVVCPGFAFFKKSIIDCELASQPSGSAQMRRLHALVSVLWHMGG